MRADRAGEWHEAGRPRRYELPPVRGGVDGHGLRPGRDHDAGRHGGGGVLHGQGHLPRNLRDRGVHVPDPGGVGRQVQLPRPLLYAAALHLGNAVRLGEVLQDHPPPPEPGPAGGGTQAGDREDEQARGSPQKHGRGVILAGREQQRRHPDAPHPLRGPREVLPNGPLPCLLAAPARHERGPRAVSGFNPSPRVGGARGGGNDQIRAVFHRLGRREPVRHGPEGLRRRLLLQRHQRADARVGGKHLLFQAGRF
mmetsp:Transcript_17192/g.48393  ORF Transcript_17192/g.48393 Transcript_17192/m.48393 type:complete len:253 (+) Transcript_17192:2879-3637(+)